MIDKTPFAGIEDGQALAQAIVDTIREPLLVLNKDLCVVAASRSFYATFGGGRRDVQGRAIYALGDGQWDIPELRVLLEEILPRHRTMEAYEVEQEFSPIGRRTMLLNAREILSDSNEETLILLTIDDVTARRVAEREKEELLQQQQILLQEMQHRIANSLQIIASILILKARTVQSAETRLHLEDAHQRILSVAAMQEQLLASRHGEPIKLHPYLTQLCETLAASMIGESRPIAIKVLANGGTATSTEAISIGLVVTELVINALKHAFTDDKTSGAITVGYQTENESWRLSVSDNGHGKPEAMRIPGLGTSIVEALAKQLDGRVKIEMGSPGTLVSITHGTISAPLPSAA